MKLIKHVKPGIGWFSKASDWALALHLKILIRCEHHLIRISLKTINRCTTCARMDDTDCTPLSQQYDFLVSYIVKQCYEL